MRRTIGEMLRYGAASLLTYAWMFGGTYALTERAGLAANWSYAIVITVTYVATYFLNACFVFRGRMTPRTVQRFAVHSLVFWALNNAFYSAMYYFTSIHYLLLVVINIAVFTVLRFLSMKQFVFAGPQAGEQRRPS
jgi:putative flippase GtrA